MANVTDRNACYDGLRQQLLKPPLRSAIAMSALGQKQTYALQQAKSALPLIATTKADIRKAPCLLYPRKRTCAAHKLMSALGQKRTCAMQQRMSALPPIATAKADGAGLGTQQAT